MEMDVRVWKRAAIISCLLLSLSLVNISTTQAAGGAYAAEISATEGLLAYYRFDGDSGAIGTTCTDAMGINNGTYLDGKDGNGDPLGYTNFNFASGAPIGETGNVALDLNDFDSCVDVGILAGFASTLDGGYPGTTGTTLEFWMKTTTTDYNKLFGLQQGSVGNSEPHFAINLNRSTYGTPSQIGMYYVMPDVNNNNGGCEVWTRDPSGTTLIDGDWHYVCMTMGFQWGYEPLYGRDHRLTKVQYLYRYAWRNRARTLSLQSPGLTQLPRPLRLAICSILGYRHGLCRVAVSRCPQRPGCISRRRRQHPPFRWHAGRSGFLQRSLDL